LNHRIGVTTLYFQVATFQKQVTLAESPPIPIQPSKSLTGVSNAVPATLKSWIHIIWISYPCLSNHQMASLVSYTNECVLGEILWVCNGLRELIMSDKIMNSPEWWSLIWTKAIKIAQNFDVKTPFGSRRRKHSKAGAHFTHEPIRTEYRWRLTLRRHRCNQTRHYRLVTVLANKWQFSFHLIVVPRYVQWRPQKVIINWPDWFQIIALHHTENKTMLGTSDKFSSENLILKCGTPPIMFENESIALCQEHP
jgi:hypothetical protein